MTIFKKLLMGGVLSAVGVLTVAWWGGIVQLPGRQSWNEGGKKNTLSGVELDTATNTVTGTYTLYVPGLTDVSIRTFQVTHHSLAKPQMLVGDPLTYVTIPVSPVINPAAGTATWLFSYQLPPGTIFGGTCLANGTYTLQSGETYSDRQALCGAYWD